MNTVKIPKKILFLYLAITPLSCLIFNLYINGVFWMFFACLFAYFIQLSLLAFLSVDNTCEIQVQNEKQLVKLDSQYRKYKIALISSTFITIILDTFPFWATSSWFCHSLGVYIPKYEGGIIVSIMTIIIILSWIVMLCMNMEVKLPSIQYNINILNQEKERKRIECEKVKSEVRHEQNLSRYGEGYTEICTQFIFNEKTKKVWLAHKEYSFDEIIDASIEDIVTQRTTGGDIVTKTNTGSMIGRAVVGGVLTGGVGAIIGGATAKKESIVTPTEIHTEHQYNLLITTKTLSNPLITISFFDNVRLVQRCLATIKAIIHNK
ncbi:MAG: hypothetical protein K2H44_08960 [Muribaculaceae bacterium]|nr:hypothetical protein [Muribaculaceae bacterium]